MHIISSILVGRGSTVAKHPLTLVDLLYAGIIIDLHIKHEIYSEHLLLPSIGSKDRLRNSV